MTVPAIADPGIPGVVGAEEVGRGGFAVVYRGEQPAFRRQVAAKVLTVELDDRSRLRFERECQALGSLSDHPGIVTVYSAGYTAAGQPFLLMPFLPGGSYEDVLRDRGAMPWQEVLDLGVRLADALRAAHDEGVLHRDIKPANVLRTRHGLPVLADFGIARIAGSRHTTTDTGSITGSVHFMAPELIDGHEPSVATDVYALGSTLYALVSGQPAFASDTDHSIVPVLHRILTRDVDPLPDEVPAIVHTVLATAMAKRPEDRHPTALALGRALQEAQRSAGEPVTPLVGAEQPTTPLAAASVTAPSLATIRDVPHHVPPPVHSDGSAAPTTSTGRGRRRPVFLAAGVLVGLTVIAAVVAAVVALRGDGAGELTLTAPVTSVGDGSELVPQEIARLVGDDGAEGDLPAGVAHLYRVEVDAGTLLRARAIALEETLDPVVGLVGPDGGLLIEDDDAGGGEFGHDGQLDWYARAAGTYAVVVSGYGATDDAGAYRVVLDVETPQPLEEAAEGVIAPHGLGVHAVTSDGGEDLVLTARSEDVDVLLSVRYPSGDVVQDDDSAGDGNALVEVEAAEAGTYLVVVTAAGDEADGAYSVTVGRR